MNEPLRDNAEPKPAYQVLARKYRPHRFDDLIGHEAMVRTLNNAFAANRIAHAYILTGVRGVGKTTTARILARALNYVGPKGEDEGPQLDMAEEGRHCRAIAESRHPDVIEMDAASRTGVGDIRELIEGVRYGPIEARYKVYIIDEVHMLSTAAFNALLKTLEEPPPHVKFIFATTEIRKVPATVLSRCQRFDLRRIDPDMLTDHLASVAEKEGVKIARENLAMIARAAEGSVRDALSILDQLIVQYTAPPGGESGEENAVGADQIRDMLGLADRTQSWALLEACLKGDAKEALDAFKGQYDAGAEAAVILRDMLDLVHLLSRVKAAGAGAAAHGPAGEADAARAAEMAAKLEMNALTRAWSLLMKGLAETNAAPDPAAAGEMALIRLCFAADLPTPDEALRALKKNSADREITAPAPPPAPDNRRDTAPAGLADLAAPESFQDVVRLAGRMRDAKLKTELDSYIHLISFSPGRMELRLHEDAPGDLANRLQRRLKEWTGASWTIIVNTRENGAETLRDRRIAEVMADPLVRKALEVFPGAELSAISEAEAPAASSPMDGDDGDGDDEDKASGLEPDGLAASASFNTRDFRNG